MRASFVDLRTRSSQVIRALKRNESVTVYYRGKATAVMQPITGPGGGEPRAAKDHPAFGLWADREDTRDVAAHVRRLRRGRFGDI